MEEDEAEVDHGEDDLGLGREQEDEEEVVGSAAGPAAAVAMARTLSAGLLLQPQALGLGPPEHSQRYAAPAAGDDSASSSASPRASASGAYYSEEDMDFATQELEPGLQLDRTLPAEATSGLGAVAAAAAAAGAAAAAEAAASPASPAASGSASGSVFEVADEALAASGTPSSSQASARPGGDEGGERDAAYSYTMDFGASTLPSAAAAEASSARGVAGAGDEEEDDYTMDFGATDGGGRTGPDALASHPLPAASGSPTSLAASEGAASAGSTSARHPQHTDTAAAAAGDEEGLPSMEPLPWGLEAGPDAEDSDAFDVPEGLGIRQTRRLESRAFRSGSLAVAGLGLGEEDDDETLDGEGLEGCLGQGGCASIQARSGRGRGSELSAWVCMLPAARHAWRPRPQLCLRTIPGL